MGLPIISYTPKNDENSQPASPGLAPLYKFREYIIET